MLWKRGSVLMVRKGHTLILLVFVCAGGGGIIIEKITAKLDSKVYVRFQQEEKSNNLSGRGKHVAATS